MENKPIRFTELSKQINSEFSKLDKESQKKNYRRIIYNFVK